MRLQEATPAVDPRLAPWSGESLSRALAQALDTPFTALRATLESLAVELQTQLPAPRMAGVLDECERLGRNVRELCDLAAAPVPRPLACSLEEVVLAARAQLRPEQRERVLLARCDPRATVLVDGPLLSGCLRRLIENALEASEEPVLVVARRDDDGAHLTVVNAAAGGAAREWLPAPFRTTKPNHLGLGLALTQRDVCLMNGRLELLSSPGGETCVRITLPAPEETR